MLKALRRLGDKRRVADRLCAGLAARAREPVFFLALAVPDTIDGRFDLLTFHAWLVLERLGAAGEQNMSQALIDAIFVQFDEGLRELGAGDIGIGHRIKKMADAFYGRLKAYGDAESEASLADAILRNIYRGETRHADAARAIAAYATAVRESLARSNVGEGALDFGALPAAAERRVS